MLKGLWSRKKLYEEAGISSADSASLMKDAWKRFRKNKNLRKLFIKLPEELDNYAKKYDNNTYTRQLPVGKEDGKGEEEYRLGQYWIWLYSDR